MAFGSSPRMPFNSSLATIRLLVTTNRVNGDRNGCETISGAGVGETYYCWMPDRDYRVFCARTSASTVCESRSSAAGSNTQSVKSVHIAATAGDTRFAGTTKRLVGFCAALGFE
jgi:hypothetical protein